MPLRQLAQLGPPTLLTTFTTDVAENDLNDSQSLLTTHLSRASAAAPLYNILGLSTIGPCDPLDFGSKRRFNIQKAAQKKRHLPARHPVLDLYNKNKTTNHELFHLLHALTNLGPE